MAEDLPALDRPAKAISGMDAGGRSASWATEVTKRAEWNSCTVGGERVGAARDRERRTHVDDADSGRIRGFVSGAPIRLQFAAGSRAETSITPWTKAIR